MAVIRGKWDTGQVWIDERELSPERSQVMFFTWHISHGGRRSWKAKG